MLVEKGIIEALRRLCWYRSVIQEDSGGCAGAEEYYRSTREAVLVQQSIIGSLGTLCRYSREL